MQRRLRRVDSTHRNRRPASGSSTLKEGTVAKSQNSGSNMSCGLVITAVALK